MKISKWKKELGQLNLEELKKKQRLTSPELTPISAGPVFSSLHLSKMLDINLETKNLNSKKMLNSNSIKNVIANLKICDFFS
jgi:hypothetical protein